MPTSRPRTIRARLAASRPGSRALRTVFVLDADGRADRTFSALESSRRRRASPVTALTVSADAPVGAVLDVFARHDVLAIGWSMPPAG